MTEAVAGPVPGPSAWQTATVRAVRVETPKAKTFRLGLSQPATHLAGQHYLLRLTAPDGYTATRSYSVASAPDDGCELELTVERLAGGEVSTFLHDEVVPGDQLEVRGPIGGWFVWRATSPALLLGGGSGVVPLMAMVRLARRRAVTDLVRLLVSVRDPDALYYADELPGPETTVIYSRAVPAGSNRRPGRLSADDLSPLMSPGGTAYICGSSAFADAASELLLGLGQPVEDIRVERFGPTG